MIELIAKGTLTWHSSIFRLLWIRHCQYAKHVCGSRLLGEDWTGVSDYDVQDLVVFAMLITRGLLDHN